MIKNLLSVLFRLSVLAFLLGGAAVVALQAAGIVLGNGAFVEAVTDVVAPWAYGAAGVAGLLAFALSYFRSGDAAADAATVDCASPVPQHEHA
jgi:hypothetical protein